MADIQHVEFIGGYSLFFEAFTTDVDPVIVDRGYSPMGYFWERFVLFLYEKDRLAGPFTFECNADWFSVSGTKDSTEELKQVLEKYTTDADAVAAVIDEAEAEEFVLEF